MQAFVPKNRRAKFDVDILIHDLNNVPLVSGHAYIKWHIPGSTRADCRGRTNREPIKDHRVVWGYHHHVPGLRFYIGRATVLQEQLIVLNVFQECIGGRERIQLGTVRLNLAEYAGSVHETRRYLMQDSKINSTVKVAFAMHHVGGDANYTPAPRLRGAQVFSGIAGIIGDQQQQHHQQHQQHSHHPHHQQHQRDPDDSRQTDGPTQSHDTGAKQEMYRRTLAASWQLIPGELNADECIEDIFAGGDGWTSAGGGNRKAKSVRLYEGSTSSRRDATSDSDSLSQLSVGTSTPITVASTAGDKPAPSLLTVEPLTANGKPKAYALSVMTARSKPPAKSRHQELDELEARADLVSWRMPGRR